MRDTRTISWTIAFLLAASIFSGTYYGAGWGRPELPPPTVTPTAVLGPPLPPQASVPVSQPILPAPDALPYVDYEGWDLCGRTWDCWQASQVQSCENPHEIPTLVSSTGDYGIMQINAETWAVWLNERGFDFWNEWYDPQRNVEMAHAIWQEYSWYEWICFRAG